MGLLLHVASFHVRDQYSVLVGGLPQPGWSFVILPSSGYKRGHYASGSVVLRRRVYEWLETSGFEGQPLAGRLSRRLS